MRAGRYVKQSEGYKAFIPAPLPPKPGVKMDGALWQALSDADRVLGRLDGLAEILPNPDLLVSMYVRKEAVLSSQIEGTQASLSDLLEFEAGGVTEAPDVGEVLNNVRAMNYGLTQLHKLPLSSRLIRNIHRELLEGVRGQEKQPGEFRRYQNWIGPPGSTLRDSNFIPPPPREMRKAIGDLEIFIQKAPPMPLLVKCGLVHAQFETIHPFIDGNGRIGRLLITFMLCHAEVLTRPLLYISHYFKEHRDEYYERLQGVRDKGEWEGWLGFFLKAVYQVSIQATQTARKILHMREQHQQLLREKGKQRVNSLALLDLLYERPIATASMVVDKLGVTSPTAYGLIGNLQKLGLLREITGRERYRIFRYQPYLDILNE